MKRSRPTEDPSGDDSMGAWPCPDPPVRPESSSSSSGSGWVHVMQPHLLSDVGGPPVNVPRAPPTAQPRGSVATASGWNPMFYASSPVTAAGPMPSATTATRPPAKRPPPPPPSTVATFHQQEEGVAISDRPFPGSHAVAVLHAAPWAWNTTVLHVGGRTKWDHVKQFIVEQNNARPGGPAGRLRVQHWAYRLVTQTSGRWLEWNKAARPTPDSMVTLERQVEGTVLNAGVWAPPGVDPRHAYHHQYSDISTIVLVPSERFQHQ